MKIEQIYTGCLAEAAYYIESNGEAAIIDPLREVAPYLKKAVDQGATIKYIFETHFHADFVSGHLDLAKQSGAKIVYGPTAQTAFDAYIATDGEIFEIGHIKIKVLHTPGHTLESTTYLLIDENGNEHCIFTGDTLFIGDVGRPDLAQKGDLTMEDLAGMLYDSLNTKIKPLADDVIVYPAHGAGSACGKNMSKETFDTLGHQKEVNYALKASTKAQFIAEVTDGILPPPQYFAQNVAMNKGGYESLEAVYQKGLVPLNPQAFEDLANISGALLLDTRDPQVFAKGFIPNAINIGLNGQFAPWVGALVPDLKQAILLITEEGKEQEAITRLARVGYDNTIGYLAGGMQSWQAAQKEVDTIESISASEFENAYLENENISTLDVRKPGEYAAEHLEFTLARPLDYINEWTSSLNPAETYFIHCAGGYRSMIAASILKARGISNVIDVAGGYGAIKNTNLKRSDFMCQSKLMR
ncbi:MAG: MBL fold metallo-hydrolase [Pedobacter sp.]|nr:MAG: MBL fold metallo-hydrolase [Pedobacter sp.]